MTQRDEEWDAATGEITPQQATGSGYWLPAPERPEQWYRENAAVFHALEQWPGIWEALAEKYQSEHGRPPSTHNKNKNKAEFRRLLVERYGRGEPDAAWLDERAAHLEKRGLAPDRSERFSR